MCGFLFGEPPAPTPASTPASTPVASTSSANSEPQPSYRKEAARSPAPRQTTEAKSRLTRSRRRREIVNTSILNDPLNTNAKKSLLGD